jgi:hypothetical protein
MQYADNMSKMLQKWREWGGCGGFTIYNTRAEPGSN